jgi:hypothetical protein
LQAIIVDAFEKFTKVVTPAPGFRRDRVAGVQKRLLFLDSGPFDKLRVPSLSRDFRRNDTRGHFLSSYETVILGTYRNETRSQGLL